MFLLRFEEGFYMKFKTVESSVKKQMKASMKRIAQKLIKLNIEKADDLDYAVAFNIWKSRYISTMNGNKYYDFIVVDDELFEDLRSTMETVFLKELHNIPVKTEAPAVEPVKVKSPANYSEKFATQKQIYYAKYLMDTVRNEPLPNKKYTMGEIGLLIKDLKSQIKSS
jgi:hypothetical protein